jgi:hypothetical protein
VICMGDGVKNRLVATQIKAIGWWELWDSMRFNELRDMRRLMLMRKEENLLKSHAHFLNTTYYCKELRNLQSQSHKIKQINNIKIKNLIGVPSYGTTPNPKFIMGLGVTITTLLGSTRPKHLRVYYFQMLSAVGSHKAPMPLTGYKRN